MKREALVVGINRYPGLRDQTTNKPKHRTTPADDAEAVAQLLEAYGNFHVRRFPVKGSEGTWQVDPHPRKGWTATDLEDAITQLFQPPGEPPETAVLFFAGHGFKKPVTVSEVFLCTSDALPEKGIYGVSLRWLRELLENSPVRQQVVWLDCCFSGELLNLSEADPGIRGKNRNRCFIAASREFEPAFEEFGGKHGVLSGALLQGLDPTQRPDGLVTNYTLTDLIENQLRSARQRPVWKNWGGEIILTGKKEKIDNPALMGKCPYKGLEYFNDNEEDAKFFHGRQKLTEKLRQKVDRGNFLAVLGSSGIGKTSVVRAGLLYQLRQGKHLSGSDQWEIRTFRPGKTPLQSLAAAFTDPKLPSDEWSQQLAAAQAMVNIGGVGLNDLVSQIDAPRLVLVADQFEEAFTLCENQAERQQFFECLLGAIREPDTKLCVVLVMRADFFSKCAERDYGGLAAQIEEHLVTVKPMTPEELEEAIVAPAKQVGLTIERELITEMIDEVKDAPGSLPLLQYTLTELWKQREVDCLRLSKYKALGGVKGALEKRANEVYDSLSPDEQKVAKRIFLELTHLGEGTEDTRRQVFLEDLVTGKQSPALVKEVIKKLADEKLVVTQKVKAFGDAQVAVVDVAHEALIRHWSLLRGWLNYNREAIRRQREIEEAARDWRGAGKRTDYLLQGLRLNDAEGYLLRYADTVPLSNIAEEFVKKSIKERQKKRLIQIVGGSTIVIILMFAGIAGIQWQSVNRQREIVFNLRLANQSDLLRDRQPGLLTQSILLALESMNRFPSLDAHEALQRGLALLPRIITIFDNKGYVKAINHSGTYLATETKEGNIIQVLEVKTGKQLSLLKHNNLVTSVAFVDNTNYVATATQNNLVRLWDIQTGREVAIMNHDDYIYTMASSSDGKYLATGSWDFSVRVWELPSGREVVRIPHKARLRQVIFSPNGKYLATILDSYVLLRDNSVYYTILVWEATTGREVVRMKHNGPLAKVVFSPDSKYLATASSDNTARVWEVPTGREIVRLTHGNNVVDVAFSPNLHYVATASLDGYARILEIESNRLVTTISHKNDVNSVAFSPDSKYLVTTSGAIARRTLNLEETAVQVWNVETGREVSRITDANFAGQINFDYEGKYILPVTGEGVTIVAEVIGNQTVITMPHQDLLVFKMAFSPDGNFLATAAGKIGRSRSFLNQTVSVWNTTTGREIFKTEQKIELGQKVFGFSLDSKYLNLTLGDDTPRAWEISTGREVTPKFDELIDINEPVAISQNAKYYATIENNSAIVWERKNQRKIAELNHDEFVRSVAFSPNEKYIATASLDKTARVWDIRSGRELGRINHEYPVGIVTFSPDGQHIATATSDFTARVWELSSRKEVARLIHDNTIWALTFSPDGRYVGTGSQDNTARIWLWNKNDLIAESCNRLTRNLTKEEWERYLPNKPYRNTCPNLP
ncbi:caspase family protein [[Phormidium] sp. ETS-05]|uniref:nSTAND1 domain-containing NTPase n=1 Tax=[Phormidium] sp. ETS-05 TaxID=222819 RepID=UPI0018EF3212|nr:caspase family protein [[Phormidium] sp. ETS-05]